MTENHTLTLLKTLFLLYEGDEVGYPDHPVLVDLDVVQEEVTLVPGQGLGPTLPAQQVPGQWSHHYSSHHHGDLT